MTFDRGEGWFMVFPDREPSVDAFRAVEPYAKCLVLHPSRRPWIVGCWSTDEFRMSRSASRALAVFGTSHVPVEQIEVGLAKIDSVPALSSFAQSLHGSSHLLASIAGQVRVQGSVTGLRRIFYGNLRGVSVATNLADVLAHCAARRVDSSMLAGRMLYPSAPHPLDSLPVWADVNALSEDSWLLLAADGRTSVEHWWSPPEPMLSLSEGATMLRSELGNAVGGYVNSRSVISADLSGGLDSTPICFLAANGSASVVAFTACRGNVDDDMHWANVAANYLPTIRRDLSPPNALPLPYDRVDESVNLKLDEPFFGAVAWRRIAYTAQRLSALGSELHLTGHGGDEVLSGSDAYVFDLVRREFFHGTQRIREHRALQRWPLVETANRIMDGTDYGDWLASFAERIGGPPPDPNAPPSVWGAPEARLPPWATSNARETVRDLLRSQAALTKAIGRTRAEHATVDLVRRSGRANRLVAQIMRAAGLTMAAPLLDDRVVECCLAVRAHDKRTPKQYKPLMVEAMRGIVPDTVLRRSTKADFTSDAYQGRRDHADRLLALCENSRLEARGLVDIQRLRDACLGVGAAAPQFALWCTLACEVWLRSIERPNPLGQRHRLPLMHRVLQRATE